MTNMWGKRDREEEEDLTAKASSDVQRLVATLKQSLVRHAWFATELRELRIVNV